MGWGVLNEGTWSGAGPHSTLYLRSTPTRLGGEALSFTSNFPARVRMKRGGLQVALLVATSAAVKLVVPPTADHLFSQLLLLL